jgi:protein tyrosine phosphatase
MVTGVINSTKLRSRGGSLSQMGCGSSRSRCSSMEEAMREQQERICEELRQQQMTFVQQQSEYMATYNA